MPTIKTKKEMNLPELIEWGWKNGIEKRSFISNGGKVTAIFEDMGRFIADNFISSDVTFTVEIEEPITEDTEFETLIEVTEHQILNIRVNRSIKEIKDFNSLEFHALVNGRLTLIWTKEKGLVE